MTTIYVDSNSPSNPGTGTLADPYRSLSIAEGALPATLADVYEVVCKASSGSADTTAVVLSGVTTSSTNTLHVYAHVDHRHNGKWNTAKYRLEVNGARAISNSLANIKFTGLQAKTTSSTSAFHCYYTAQATSTFIQCIAAGTAGTGNGFHIDSVAATCRNCIAYACNSGFAMPGGASTFHNCTAVANRVSGFAKSSSGTPTATNCYAGGNSTSDYSGTITKTTCASSDTTGSTGLQSIAYSASSGAKFVNITGGSEDFHLQSGSSLIGAGTDLSGTFTTDIDGETRSGTWDIGADEYVSNASPISGSGGTSYVFSEASTGRQKFAATGTASFPYTTSVSAKQVFTGSVALSFYTVLSGSAKQNFVGSGSSLFAVSVGGSAKQVFVASGAQSFLHSISASTEQKFIGTAAQSFLFSIGSDAPPDIIVPTSAVLLIGSDTPILITGDRISPVSAVLLLDSTSPSVSSGSVIPVTSGSLLLSSDNPQVRAGAVINPSSAQMRLLARPPVILPLTESVRKFLSRVVTTIGIGL
jgi:hypothetical protein